MSGSEGPNGSNGSLTDRQREVLETILEHYLRTGAPPTYRELADQLAYRSVASVASVTRALIAKGHLRNQSSGRARGLMPVAATPATSLREVESLALESEFWAARVASLSLAPEDQAIVAHLQRIARFLRSVPSLFAVAK